jgi:hypothetical protein
MRTVIQIFTFLMLSFSAFSQSFKSSIPDKDDMNYRAFTYVKNLTKQLHLESLEKGFDSLVIRIWYVTGRGFNQMYELKYSKNVWSATHYPYIVAVPSKNNQYPIRHRESKALSFKSDPQLLFSKLKSFGIDTLHSTDNIEMKDVVVDGIVYYFEVAERKLYNFYVANNPLTYGIKYKQAALSSSVINTLDKEFDISKRTIEIYKLWQTQYPAPITTKN